jgi:hypothetical protein
VWYRLFWRHNYGTTSIEVFVAIYLFSHFNHSSYSKNYVNIYFVC